MTIRRTASPDRHSQQGIALVETAIAMPLLLLLLVAVGELGHAMYQYNTLQKTVRDAVRYLSDAAVCDDTGVIKINTCPGASSTTKNLAVYGSPATGTALLPGLTTSNVTLSSPDATHVRVQVTYTYQPMFADIPTFGYGNQDITMPTTFTVTATMRAL